MDRTVDRGSPTPPFEQVADALRGQIQRGTLKVRDKLPSLDMLGTRYGVTRTTARKAVAVLVAEGLVGSRPGWGTFVIRRRASS